MFKVPEKYRVINGQFGSDSSYGNNGQFIIPKNGKDIKSLFVQASDGGGWEHLSVSIIPKPGKKRRLPTHGEMEYVRFAFWEKTDWIIEFHPPVTEYVNNAPCLHLWRPIGVNFPTPDSLLVGIKSK